MNRIKLKEMAALTIFLFFSSVANAGNSNQLTNEINLRSKSKFKIKEMSGWCLYAIQINQGNVIPNFEKGENNKNIHKHSDFDLLSKLLDSVDQCIKDSVLKKLHLDVQQLNEKEKRTASIPTMTFIPVLQLSDLNDNSSINKEFACFYSEENGEFTYYIAKYSDQRNFTKDTNPEMYNGFKEVLGQESADRSIDLIRNKTGANGWRITAFTKEDILFDCFEYARRHTDNGKIFLLTKGSYHHLYGIFYFKDKEILSAHKTTKENEIQIMNLRKLIRR